MMKLISFSPTARTKSNNSLKLKKFRTTGKRFMKNKQRFLAFLASQVMSHKMHKMTSSSNKNKRNTQKKISMHCEESNGCKCYFKYWICLKSIY